MTADDLAAEVGRAAGHELGQAFERIQHCVNQLSDVQVWSRPTEPQNSIGNLLLHLAGNVRQYLIAGVGRTPDTRDRPREFTERSLIPKAQLLEKLGGTVAEAKAVIGKVTADELLLVSTIQNREFTALAAIMQAVAHFRGHVQEITFMTRSLIGDAYRYAGPPPEKITA